MLNTDPSKRPTERECLRHPWLADVVQRQPEYAAYDLDDISEEVEDNIGYVDNEGEDGDDELHEMNNGENNNSSKVNAARSILKRANMDGHIACLQANDDAYLGLFRKARFAVKHMVICHADGHTGPIAPDFS